MNKTQLLRFLAPAALTVGALALSTPAAAVDVGVSIGVSQPGVYGRIDIGRFPQPQIYTPQPVMVQPVMGMAPPPAYMWVPPGHRKNWRKHCARYNACGMPVYFVQDGWYQRHVQPHAAAPMRPAPPPPLYGQRPRDEGARWEERRGGRDDDHPGRGHGRGHGRGDDNDQGNGNGNGRGRGHGKD